MNEATDNPACESHAPAPTKAGDGASRVTTTRVRRLRVPTPPALDEDDRQRVVFILDAAPDPMARVLVVLVEVDGFVLVDAAAIIGVAPRWASEQLRSLALVAGVKLGFDRKAKRLQQHNDESSEAGPIRPRVYFRPAKHGGDQ